MFVKKAIFLIAVVLTITLAAYSYLIYKSSFQNFGKETLTPVNNEKNKEQTESGSKPIDAFGSQLYSLDKKHINIALLGIDRRSKFESAYRTDTIIVLSINPTTNRILLISIPRDLWYGGTRVNALYIQNGWESLETALNDITGLEINKFILTDFEDFSWIVDSMGGVTVDVENSFTDVQYPIDITKTYQTVSFETGTESMSGERALIFSRSRKGDNGEGSDWARMKRQHLLLKGMVNSVLQPKSIFNPMNVETAFKLITTNRMDTNLTLSDAEFLWDMYKDKDKYTYKSMFLNSDFVYNPPMEDYGGAWVLVPTEGNYSKFNGAVKLESESETATNISVQ